jgi:hypothetical protein
VRWCRGRCAFVNSCGRFLPKSRVAVDARGDCDIAQCPLVTSGQVSNHTESSPRFAVRLARELPPSEPATAALAPTWRRSRPSSSLTRCHRPLLQPRWQRPAGDECRPNPRPHRRVRADGVVQGQLRLPRLAGVKESPDAVGAGVPEAEPCPQSDDPTAARHCLGC